MATYKRRTRSRGRVEQLPSGSLRVVVYAGTDPLTGRRHFLREVIPAGPKAADEAEKAVRRLATQVDERKHPRTNATLDQLLDRYLEMLDIGEGTKKMYAKYWKSTFGRSWVHHRADHRGWSFPGTCWHTGAGRHR